MRRVDVSRRDRRGRVPRPGAGRVAGRGRHRRRRRRPPAGPGRPRRDRAAGRPARPRPGRHRALRCADAVFHLAGRPGVRDTGAAADAARTRDNVLRHGRRAGHRAARTAAGRHLVLVRVRRSPPAGRPGRPTRCARSARTRAARRRWSCSAPAGRSRCCGRSRSPARGSGRTWHWPGGSPRSGPATRSGSSARRRAPGTSPTCGTWSGPPGWRPSGASSGRSTSAPAGRARWPSWPARSAGCWRAGRAGGQPGRRGGAGRDLGRHHPAGPYARLRAGHRPRRRGRPPGRPADRRRPGAPAGRQADTDEPVAAVEPEAVPA